MKYRNKWGDICEKWILKTLAVLCFKEKKSFWTAADCTAVLANLACFPFICLTDLLASKTNIINRIKRLGSETYYLCVVACIYLAIGGWQNSILRGGGTSSSGPAGQEKLLGDERSLTRTVASTRQLTGLPSFHLSSPCLAGIPAEPFGCFSYTCQNILLPDYFSSAYGISCLFAHSER